MLDIFKDHDEIYLVAPVPDPQITKRFINAGDDKIILDFKTKYTLADDKELYPSIFENVFDLRVITRDIDFTFKVEGKCNTIVDDLRYRWNNADIIGPIQIIALCSKDDRRVVYPSGIHDYMLEFAEPLFREIKKQYPEYTIAKYRKLTSLIFEYNLVSQGMGKFHAKLMANAVDFFQKYDFQKYFKMFFKNAKKSNWDFSE